MNTIEETTDQAERQRRRRIVRTEIAAIEITRALLLDKETVIRAVEQERDTAVAIHQERCRPVQAELAAIEEAQVAQIVDRVPADPAIDSRRRELLAELEAANVALETATTAATTRLKRLAGERAELRNAMQKEIALTNLLMSHELADPKLYPIWEASKIAIQYATARHASAMQKVALSKERVEYSLQHRKNEAPGNLATYRARLATWQVELSEATTWLRDAEARETSLRRQLISE